MTMFDDRERAYEAKFRMDQETAFRITVRRDKLLGLWAAELMGMGEDEAKAYARTVVDAELEHHEVVAKIVQDLAAYRRPLDEEAVRRRMADLHELAREQIFAEQEGR